MLTKSPQYLDRLNAVLSNRFDTHRERTRPKFLALRAVGAGLVGAALCLVVLKGMAIAQGDVAFRAGADRGWLEFVLGPDPLSYGVSQAFARPGSSI